MIDVTAQFKETVKKSLDVLNQKPQQNENFVMPWVDVTEIVSATCDAERTTGRLVVRFPVLRRYTNPADGFHGGAMTTFFDVVTSWLLFLVCRPGYWMSNGTTRSLNCVYLRPAFVGEQLRIESEIVHVGKRLCLLRATLKREKDGAVIATCEHNKYNIDADVAKV